MNKSERLNEFVQWIAFGGDSVIAKSVRAEQSQFLKYNYLAALSPYQTPHINQFGQPRRMPDPPPLVRKPPNVETGPVATPRLAADGGS